ncbi:Rpn family recombination-promoting nuclease/putative transposase [Serratia nevei]|uniref:Rpn family recombination-promoting nuclease/putative transposase n=1 Tax=Serratia nevei TaxID=2703794 RepID=UPI003696597D
MTDGSNVTLTTKEQLVSLMNYMLQVGDTASPEKFIRELARRALQQEEVLMNIAQKLEQEGLEHELEKGRLEERQEGVLEGKLAVARTMLANGIDRDSVMKMTGLTAADLAQIRH